MAMLFSRTEISIYRVVILKLEFFFFTALGLCCGTQAFLWLQRTASLVVARGL